MHQEHSHQRFTWLALLQTSLLLRSTCPLVTTTLRGKGERVALEILKRLC